MIGELIIIIICEIILLLAILIVFMADYTNESIHYKPSNRELSYDFVVDLDDVSDETIKELFSDKDD